MKKLMVTIVAMAALTAVAEVYPYGVCAHITRKSWEGDPYRFKHTIGSMELAGMRYVRSDFDTPTFRRKDGTYDFSEYDGIIVRLEKCGMKLLPIIYGLDGNRVPKTDSECAEYREFICTIISHYGMRCPVVEIWNEANLDYFMRGAGASEYARMLKIAYEAVKSVNPEVKVAFTGTSGVPLQWIRTVLENGAAKSFDIMNVHPYSHPLAPEGIIDKQIENLKKLLAEFGRSDAPIWISEIGWPTHAEKLPHSSVFLAGLKVARPQQKSWNIILADNLLEGNPSQKIAEQLADILPAGSCVKACSQKETCEKLAGGGIDAVVYPFNESFPADTIDAVNDFIRIGGVFVDFGGTPCYYPRRNGAAAVDLPAGSCLCRFPFGFSAWWTDKEGVWPKDAQVMATDIGLAAGVKQEPTGFSVARYLVPERIGKDSEWIPLIAGKSESGKDIVAAAVVRYRGERNGAAVLCSLMPSAETNDEENQAMYTARSMGLSFAEGIEAYFQYNLRAREDNTYYSEDHFGLMHANFQPKPAYSAYAQFTNARPAGSVQKSGEWHDAKRTFYYPQWTRPDGKKAGMLWTSGAPFERTIRFIGGTPIFYNMYGRKIDFREVENGVYKLKISGSPVYFVGAEIESVQAVSVALTMCCRDIQ